MTRSVARNRKVGSSRPSLASERTSDPRGLIESLKIPEGRAREFKRDLSTPEGALRTDVTFANTEETGQGPPNGSSWAAGNSASTIATILRWREGTSAVAVIQTIGQLNPKYSWTTRFRNATMSAHGISE